jgi:hypothetical protein
MHCKPRFILPDVPMRVVQRCNDGQSMVAMVRGTRH